MRALRDAVLVTDSLAVAVVVWRMCAAGWYLWSILVVLAMLVVMLRTCYWLESGRSPRRAHK